MIEAPWLVNGGHGASFSRHYEREARPTRQRSLKSLLPLLLELLDDGCVGRLSRRQHSGGLARRTQLLAQLHAEGGYRPAALQWVLPVMLIGVGALAQPVANKCVS
jgi:hypothetical protein